MIPIADSPRDPTHRPWATRALIVANLLVGAATLPWPWLSWVVHDYGFRPAEPSLLTTVSAMFLLAGFFHLAGNMLYLWIYGPNVERRLGRAPFVLLYFTTGMLGTLLYALMSLGSPIPAVGASGAISGLLGAYLVFFPLHTIWLWLYITTIRVPAWLVLLFFLIVDNMVPFLLGLPTSTAHAAHIGGFFAGMVLAMGLRLLQPVADADRRPRADPLAHPLGLVRQGMLLDAHQALVKLAASPKPEVAAAARRELEKLETDPTYQRAAQRGK
jgi:membrane associated rhomboid family serine protease